MKALQIEGTEKVSVVKVPIPKPGPNQVLVKVRAVTTCPQWDLHIFYGKPMFPNQATVPFPYSIGQPGHEMTGTVEEIGEGCSLDEGQTVCAWKDPGHDLSGCYAEYVLMEEKFLIPIPDHLPYQKVASLELAMCVASSILRMKSTVGIQGKKCGVNGLGPAGIIALQMLLAEGANEVIGIDPNEERRKLVQNFWVSHVCAPNSDNLIPRYEKGAFDISIDCVGYPQAVNNIMDYTKEAVALFAVQRDDYTLNHPGLTVIGYPGHYREAADYALQLIIDGKLDLSSLITCELPFESYETGIRLLKDQQAIKICYVPQ